jgi:hypothetical protein
VGKQRLALLRAYKQWDMDKSGIREQTLSYTLQKEANKIKTHICSFRAESK